MVDRLAYEPVERDASHEGCSFPSDRIDIDQHEHEALSRHAGGIGRRARRLRGTIPPTADPYRTPGDPGPTPEEQRAAWLHEYQNMGLCDTRRYTPEQLARFEARYAEIERLLLPPQKLTQPSAQSIEQLHKALGVTR